MPFNVCVSRLNAPERGSIGKGMEEPPGRTAGPALPFQAPFSSVGGSRGFSLLEMMAVIDLILVLRRRPRRGWRKHGIANGGRLDSGYGIGYMDFNVCATQEFCDSFRVLAGGKGGG
jgi:prepilin-type N-terminal cleavage/methylation domain-containing protein